MFIKELKQLTEKYPDDTIVTIKMNEWLNYPYTYNIDIEERELKDGTIEIFLTPNNDDRQPYHDEPDEDNEKKKENLSFKQSHMLTMEMINSAECEDDECCECGCEEAC